jgi:hypothetical protein
MSAEDHGVSRSPADPGRVKPEPETAGTFRPPMKRGAALGFEGGTLHLRLAGYPDPGSGHFAFTDDELEPVREYNEDGVWDGFIVKLPSSELLAIRDFLNAWLPAADQPASPTQPDPQDA